MSHETIYRALFVQARGSRNKELQVHLRTNRPMRRSKKSTLRTKGRGQIRDAVSISKRPPEVEDRAVPGHWEGDFLLGSGSTQIATLVERASRFKMLIKVESRQALVVARVLEKQIVELPGQLRRSLTWDRGHEMAEHASFTLATGVQVYFCEPQSPWQRGSNENTNRLLRQYFPKRTPLGHISQQRLNAIAKELNERPRKTLSFEIPAGQLSVALTH